MSKDNKIKKLRTEARLSQNRLAAKADLDRGTISNCENGGQPSDMTLAKLASALSEALGRPITETDLH